MIVKKEKNSIWIYAVILFSCAFMILLLTFFSQEKLQQNTKKYANQISSVNKNNETVITNLKSARDMNKKLQAKIDELSKALETSKLDAEKAEQANKEKIEKLSSAKKTNTTLAQAVLNYINEKYVSCGDTLLLIDKKTLSTQEVSLYKILADRTFEDAAYSHYKKGYKLYRKKDFKSAVVEFDRVNKFDNKFYFSDDSYWFLAYSYLKSGDKEKAKTTYEQLISKFPNSELSKASDEFYEQLQ